MSLSDILKTENIIKISPEENLSVALSQLKSAHDGAFVFDEKDKFLGMINPYYCLIKSSYPGNAKVKNCLYHPPKIKINTPLTKVSQLFIDSKIHYLPVFDEKENFLGIISARRLLANLRLLPIFQTKIEEVLKKKNRPLTVVSEEDTIGKAINLFRSTKYSKLVIIDGNFRLKGILSYFDLITYLISPKDSQGKGDRYGNKNSFYHLKIKNFMKKYVLTLPKKALLSQAIDLILTKKIGSIVIIDEAKRPIGIITTKDLLNFYISKETSFLPTLQLGGFFNRFKKRITSFKLLNLY